MTEDNMKRIEQELLAIEQSRLADHSNITEALAGKADRQERSNIPPIYFDAHLGNFRTPVYEDQGTVKLMNQIIKEWYRNFEENDRQGKGLYLWSKAKGSGKTRMAVSLFNEMMVEHGVVGYFATSTQIITEIKNTWDNDYVSEGALLDKLTKYRVLIIDDFGTEMPKQWINERFYHIINERYTHRKMTIYTSNYDLDELKYDDRIIDRIYEKSIIVQMPEESIRRKLAKAEQEEIIRRLQKGQGS